MANDTYADAREELQVTASWFSLLGPFHTPASTSFLEEERTHGKIGPSLLSQHPSWGLGLVRESLSFMSSSGLYLDFTDEETDQKEMPAGGRHGCSLEVRQDQPSWRWSSALCVADASRTEATFFSLTQEGGGRTLGCRGKSSTSPLPRWGRLLFFSQGLTLSTSPTLVSHPSSRRMPAHLHLRQSKWAQSLSWSPIALGSGIFNWVFCLIKWRFSFKLWNWVSVSLFHEMCHQKKKKSRREENQLQMNIILKPILFQ